MINVIATKSSLVHESFYAIRCTYCKEQYFFLLQKLIVGTSGGTLQNYTVLIAWHISKNQLSFRKTLVNDIHLG